VQRWEALSHKPDRAFPAAEGAEIMLKKLLSFGAVLSCLALFPGQSSFALDQLEVSAVHWDVNASDPAVATQIEVDGAYFDNGYWPPTLTLDGHELVVDASLSTDSYILASIQEEELEQIKEELPAGFYLQVLTGLAPENMDVFCFELSIDDPPVDCAVSEPDSEFDFTHREVIWRVPQGPRGESTATFAFEYGPTSTNDKLSKFGDPVYYQLMKDYTINLKDYLDNYDENYFGDELISRCEGALSDLRTALEEFYPVHAGGFFKIVSPGILTVEKGYRWDGPSIAARHKPGKYKDPKIYIRTAPKYPALMRTTVVHDVLYDMMRKDSPPRTFYNRKLADCLYYMLARQDNMERDKVGSDYGFLRLGGWSRINDPWPEWKYHARADAGADRTMSCAPVDGTFVELNGWKSDNAYGDLEWQDETGATVGTGYVVETFLLPRNRPYVFTFIADDGDDFDDPAIANDLNFSNDGPFRDTDEVEITVAADTVYPEFMVAEDFEVNNDPGQCLAEVNFRVIATDDCGPPTVTCKGFPGEFDVDPSGPGIFPVGTTKVECKAADANQSAEVTVFVNVLDVELPVIEGITAPICLWPPNKKYETLHLTDFVHQVLDNCGVAEVAIAEVTSDEEDPHTSDIVLAPDGQSLKLRRERIASRNGRAYSIAIDATDDSGNVSRKVFEVHVPIDAQCQVINDGPP